MATSYTRNINNNADNIKYRINEHIINENTINEDAHINYFNNTKYTKYTKEFEHMKDDDNIKNETNEVNDNDNYDNDDNGDNADNDSNADNDDKINDDIKLKIGDIEFSIIKMFDNKLKIHALDNIEKIQWESIFSVNDLKQLTENLVCSIDDFMYVMEKIFNLEDNTNCLIDDVNMIDEGRIQLTCSYSSDIREYKFTLSLKKIEQSEILRLNDKSTDALNKSNLALSKLYKLKNLQQNNFTTSKYVTYFILLLLLINYIFVFKIISVSNYNNKNLNKHLKTLFISTENDDNLIKDLSTKLNVVKNNVDFLLSKLDSIEKTMINEIDNINEELNMVKNHTGTIMVL